MLLAGSFLATRFLFYARDRNILPATIPKIDYSKLPIDLILMLY
jgi:hypothetical protein